MRHATMSREMGAHSFTKNIYQVTGSQTTRTNMSMCLCRRNDRICSPVCMYAYDSWDMGPHATHVEFMGTNNRCAHRHRQVRVWRICRCLWVCCIMLLCISRTSSHTWKLLCIRIASSYISCCKGFQCKRSSHRGDLWKERMRHGAVSQMDTDSCEL